VVSDMFFSIANNEQAVNYADQQVQALKRGGADPHDIARALLLVVDFLIPMDVNDVAEAKAREALALAGGNAALTARAHASLAQALMYGNKDLPAAKVEIDAAQAALARGAASRIDRALVSFARGNWLAFSSRANEARVMYDETIAAALSEEGPMSKLAMYARLEAAKTLIFDDQNEAGRAYLDAALRMMRSSGGANDVNAALWESRGASWLYMGDALPFAEVSVTFERNLASLLAQKWWSPDKYIATLKTQFGYALLRWGDIERGLKLILMDPTSTADSTPLARWWKLRSDTGALMLSDRADQAPAMIRQMLVLQQSWQSPNDIRSTYDWLVRSLVYARRHAEAEQALAEYRALQGVPADASLTPASGETPPTSHLLLALETGRYREVLEMTARLEPKPGVHADETAWLARAAALCASGQPAEADRLFAEWLPRLAHDRYEANPHVAYWRARMGLCALAGGHRQRAREASALATAALVRQPGVSEHFKAPVDELRRRFQR
jgi:hypothetical protein